MFAANSVLSAPTQGRVWTSNNSGFSTTSTYLRIVWNNSKFLVGGSGGGLGNSGVAISSDGISWSWNTGLQSAWGSSAYFRDVCYGGSTYVAVGSLAGSNPVVATSSDGVTWTARTGPAWGSGVVPYGVAWNGSVFLMVGEDCHAATSPDGVTWTNQTGLAAQTTGASEQPVSFYGNFYVIGGENILRSQDNGVTWDIVNTGGFTLLTTGNGVLMAYEPTGVISTSTTGEGPWIGSNGPSLLPGWTGTSIISIGYAAGQFFALGLNGNLASSYSGKTWVNLTSVLPSWGSTGSGRTQLIGGSQNTILAFAQIGISPYTMKAAYSR